MCGDIDTVLDEIKDWFGVRYGENFELKRDSKDEFALYQSENYEFEVAAAFIQARTYEDVQVPIKVRLAEVLRGASIEKGKRYRLSSKVVEKPMPIEYCVERTS